MALANITVGSTWELIIPSAATWFLATTDSPTIVEWGTGADDSTLPTATIGWRLRATDGTLQGLTRALVVEGPLYARVASQSSSKTAVIAFDADVHPS